MADPLPPPGGSHRTAPGPPGSSAAGPTARPPDGGRAFAAGPTTGPPDGGARLRAATPAELVAVARRGDREAFGELMRRYRPRIYALALHLTGDTHDADDIAQETFLRAYRKLGEFRAVSEFYTWVYRIAVNLSLNLQRQNGRRRTATMDDQRVALAVQVDAYGDPRRAAELRQIYGRLMVALDALSPPLRSTVVLVTLQGLTHEQAGEILGCSTGTVAWRIHEARQRLAAALAPSPPSEDSGLIALIPLLGR